MVTCISNKPKKMNKTVLDRLISILLVSGSLKHVLYKTWKELDKTQFFRSADLYLSNSMNEVSLSLVDKHKLWTQHPVNSISVKNPYCTGNKVIVSIHKTPAGGIVILFSEMFEDDSLFNHVGSVNAFFNTARKVVPEVNMLREFQFMRRSER